MQILVISDSHGKMDKVLELLKIIECDYIIHLGDNYDDAEIISKNTNKEVFYVKGNCDYYDINTNSEKFIELGGKKLFITHGHEYDVKNTYSRIYYRGIELGADLVLFGHTHVPLIEEYDEIILFNPGSISIPKLGNKPSFGIVEIENSKIKTNIKEL